MKRDHAGAPAWRMYPHIVRRVGDRDVRSDLHITNEPLPADRAGWHAAYAFSRPGAVDRDGSVTDSGRAAIVEQLQARMHPNSETCVVWGPRSCTFVSRAGTIEGDEPPDGDPSDPSALARLGAAPDVEGVWIALQPGAAASHLFLRRLAFDRIEIATAAPMSLGNWDQPLREGEPDPFDGCFDEDDAFVPPRHFRGTETFGVGDGTLLGPVQPDGRAFRVVRPWPSAVRAACLELAGRPLPSDLLLAAWRSAMALEFGGRRSGSRPAA